MKKSQVIMPILSLFLSMSCGESPKSTPSDQPESSYSLLLGEEEIAVDSVQAYVWYEDQLKQHVLTMKIYCTSEYPIYDSAILTSNHYVHVVVQAPAEQGLYTKFGEGKSFINDIRFELPTVGGSFDPVNGRSINIKSVDMKQLMVSCEVNFFEYLVLPIEEQIARSMQRSSENVNRAMIFKGENIPFTMK